MTQAGTQRSQAPTHEHATSPQRTQRQTQAGRARSVRKASKELTCTRPRGCLPRPPARRTTWPPSRRWSPAGATRSPACGSPPTPAPAAPARSATAPLQQRRTMAVSRFRALEETTRAHPDCWSPCTLIVSTTSALGSPEKHEQRHREALREQIRRPFAMTAEKQTAAAQVPHTAPHRCYSAHQQSRQRTQLATPRFLRGYSRDNSMTSNNTPLPTNRSTATGNSQKAVWSEFGQVNTSSLRLRDPLLRAKHVSMI